VEPALGPAVEGKKLQAVTLSSFKKFKEGRIYFIQFRRLLSIMVRRTWQSRAAHAHIMAARKQRERETERERERMLVLHSLFKFFEGKNLGRTVPG
jgi:hypothetical protein